MSLFTGDDGSARPHEGATGRPAVSEGPPSPARQRGERAPTIAVGASAGGLDALKRLLGALPTHAKLAVVDQHLSPLHESLLTSALGAASPLAVVEVQDGGRLVSRPGGCGRPIYCGCRFEPAASCATSAGGRR